jgi:hypothetical protein
MGTIEKGFLGGFKGILGSAIGNKWKKKSVIKSQRRPNRLISLFQRILPMRKRWWNR